MPYIDPTVRTKLDPCIEALVRAVTKDRPFTLDGAGHLNYAITRLMLLIAFPDGRVNYPSLALLTGVLNNVSDELYRRVIVPYENQKRNANGDVYEDIH